MADNAKWYVMHTYSGYEKKVETNIRKMIDNRNMQDEILDIRVPEEEVIEGSENDYNDYDGLRRNDSSGKKNKLVKRKIFPGYVFIKMVMSDTCWHAVRSIRGVTGFVGPESKPVPLSDEELENMHLESRPVQLEFGVGDVVVITDGPFSGYHGRVLEVMPERGKVKLAVDLFMGRETEVDLDISQTEPLD